LHAIFYECDKGPVMLNHEGGVAFLNLGWTSSEQSVPDSQGLLSCFHDGIINDVTPPGTRRRRLHLHTHTRITQPGVAKQ